MKIDEVRTVRDLLLVEDADLYDETPGHEESRLKLRDGLSAIEEKDARFWLPYMKGLMLVSGPPGSGKGVFGHMLTWKAKRYYEGKLAMLDTKPRRLFGLYHPFTREVLVEQLMRIEDAMGWKVLSEKGSEDYLEVESDVSLGDVSSGYIFLKNAIVLLDEFHSYMDRRVRRPMGHAIGDLFKIWRHLNMLVIGMTTEEGDLDYKRCIRAVTSFARCRVSIKNPDVFVVTLKKVKFDGSGLRQTGKKVTITINGARAREALGGLRYYDLFNSYNLQRVEIPKSLLKEQ